MEFLDLFDPNRGWRQWEIHEIYEGQSNVTGLYIPNVRDLIYDIDGGFVYKVTDVDSTTGLTTKQIWSITPSSSGATDLDTFISTGPGTASEAFRCYLDTTVMPFSMALDSRLYMYSTEADFVKVFKGNNITNTGVIISAYYDQSGTFISDSIPLELATVPDQNNISIRSPKVGWANQTLQDGELVTVVVYNTVSDVISTSQLVIKNTHFIKDGSSSSRYVIGISIKSPFVSQSDPYVLQYPVNATVDSSNMKGLVHYSDGDIDEWPIDGTKMTLHGLNGYISSQAGQRVPLVLSYKFSAGETSFNSNIAANGEITQPYYFESVTANGAYSVKLFGYPRWLDDARGYTMDYWLYNLDRDITIPVTPWVELATNSAPFEPLLYATAQTFTVTLDLNEVDPMMSAYNHVQTFNVVLNSRGSVMTVPNWTIAFTPGQSPRYGEHGVATLHMVSSSVWTMDISCGRGSKEDWIRELYYYSQPLYNPQSEVEAPIPTHVEIVFKNYSLEISVDQWGSVLNVQNDLAQGELLRLRWIKRTVNGDLQLATSCIPVHIV